MKKYLFPFLTLLLIVFIGLQIYFDFQVRKLNGGLIFDDNLAQKFFVTEFPDQVKDFNNKLKNPNQPTTQPLPVQPKTK